MILPENSTGLFVDRSILILESKGLKLESSLRLCWLQQFERTTKGAIYASNKYLAEKLEISEAKLSRLLKELEDFGLIERTVIRDPITKEVKKRLITTAPFLKLINGELKGIVTEGEQPEQPKEEVPKEQPKKTENKDKPKQPKKTAYTEEFEYFTKEVYKKKRAKQSAFKSFNKALKEVSYQELIDIVTIYKEWAGLKYSNLDFMMNFENFINQGKFLEKEDMLVDIEEMKKNPKQKKSQQTTPTPAYNKFEFLQ